LDTSTHEDSTYYQVGFVDFLLMAVE